MGESDLTRPSLLLRLRDPRDDDAWQQFAQLYGPLVYQFARKRGLQDADAADLTQNVLQAVSGSIRRLDYDPERGSFRSWLFVLVRNQFAKLQAGSRHAPRGTGDTAAHELLGQQPARADEEEAVWDREYQRQLVAWAAERVRGQFGDAVWQAFWQTAVEGKAAREVADALGMSVGSVYTAKSRVLNRVKKEIEQVQGQEDS